jgi:hypothetical protein
MLKIYPVTTLAVEAAMTEEEKKVFLTTFTEKNPHYRGAPVADVLEVLFDRDCYLAITEPLYEAHKDELKPPDLLPLATFVVIYTKGPEQATWENVKTFADRVKVHDAS